EHDGLPYLSLEYVEGGSLSNLLDEGPLQALQAAAMIECLAGAIHHAHQQGIIHRDLKPANILLRIADASISDCGLRIADSQNPSGQSAIRNLQSAIPKVTDFGLAKCIGGESGLTGPSATVGTPSYMAPEQATGQSDAVGPRSDVYALGAILYEMLTG